MLFMNRFWLLCVLLCPVWASAQSGIVNVLWTAEPRPPALQQGQERRIEPQQYQTFALDVSALRSLLAAAPLEGSAAAKTRPILLELPMPDGATARFGVWESPIMAAELGARFPEIRTYAGRGLADASLSVRFDLTPQGFHAMVFTQQQGTVFIDPLYHGQDRLYQVYARRDFVPPPHKTFSCAAEESPATDPHAPRGGKRFGDCQLRNYRLALACMGEYAQYHGSEVPLILGAMATTMNRVNGVYEREFAVRMTIIANNDTLIFMDPETDPYTDDDILGANQTIIDSLIGNDNYDIGHVFGTGGGGVAGYGVVCAQGAKAIGYTGIFPPTGDPFDIDYVSHEIGHQFAGSHTFRGCGNNNEQDITALEPGSGSTIMAYAGICGDNVQLNSDDYFHGYNLEEMTNFVAFGGGNTCGERIPLNNVAPEVETRQQAYVIPMGTPFFLTAAATDADGDALTYCWEQFDSELSTQPPLPTNAGGPNFRTLDPSASPTRYFPALPALANGGPFDWEVLPTVARRMNFRVSVRDNAPGGGCTDHGSAVVTVSDAAGPFVLTTPDAAGIRWAAGGQEAVRWNVANTQLAPVSCAEVDILLSVDGGLSYPIVLAAGVPNNGLYAVDVPVLATEAARVMVVCAGNIFFDVSNNNFSIGAPAAGFVLSTQPNALNTCGADALTLSLSADSTAGFEGQVALGISGLPEGVTATFAPDTLAAGSSGALTLSGLAAAEPGQYLLTLAGNGPTGEALAGFVLNVSPALPDPIQPIAPVDGAFNAALQPLLVWNTAPGADTYTLQVADNSSFSPLLLEQSGLTGDSYLLPNDLPDGDTLYWRLKAANTCGEGAFGPAHVFSTTAIVCVTLASEDLPLFITPNDTTTVVATINFPIAGIVTDVNVPVLAGTHDWINDLNFFLRSPADTTIALLGPVCWDEDHFNIRLDDQATAPYGAIPCPPVDGGLYQPRSPLSIFNGQNPEGTWALRVFDSWAADGGELAEWSLEVCYLPLPNAGCALRAEAAVAATGCTPCANDVSLTVSGATGQTAYLWSNGGRENTLRNVCPGNYTVTVVDAASCSVTLDVAVEAPVDFLTVSAEATPAQDANNGSAAATATGGTAPLSYAWNTGDTTAVIAGLAPGVYSVTVTDANGCTATTEVVVEFVTGTSDLPGLNLFKLLPNPTSGQFQVLLAFDEQEDVTVELYAANGQLLQRSVQHGQRQQITFDLANQSDGIFFIWVHTARGSVSRPVVLVKK